mmetsp:Transcript_109622/g.341648  ORF Transcript_109622/g.341648 Transcript_109622/m.341648 type:complete len:102 (+) Transcript_109622:456-761(+)
MRALLEGRQAVEAAAAAQAVPPAPAEAPLLARRRLALCGSAGQLLRPAVHVRPRGSRASMFLRSTLKMYSGGARHTLLQHTLLHCQSSVLPWHSRTSSAPK